LDVGNGKQIDPMQDTMVTTAAIPGASVMIEAGTLMNQQGTPFNGVLSITRVPPSLTPAALPFNMRPELVVTIQPGEMVFSQPAPMSFPNLENYPPNMLMDLWSINPTTGEFDDVGDMRVSADGTIIETISGGVRNSSWHYPSPPIPAVGGSSGGASANSSGESGGHNTCPAPVTSVCDLQSGALMETHELVGYESLGAYRGLTLHYDSLRADPRPIVHLPFAAPDLSLSPDLRGNFVTGNVRITRGGFSHIVPGFHLPASAPGTPPIFTPYAEGDNFWRLTDGEAASVGMQADLRSQPTGRYTATSVRVN
jgi:hypothetical protein